MIRLRFPRFSRTIKEMGIILLLSSLGFAFAGSIMSIYINSFVHSDSLVGFVFTGLVCLSILVHFFIIPYIEKGNKSRIYFVSSILVAIGYFLYYLIGNFYLFLAVAAIVTILITFKITTGGLLVEHYSNKRNLSKNEGVMYTFIDLAWIIGPLIAGLVLSQWGEKPVFLFASVFMLLSGIAILLFNINYSGKVKKSHDGVLKNFYEFFKDKNRLKSYLLGAGSNFWWSFVFVYIPLLIIKYFKDSSVGYFIFFAMLPLILLQYYFGKLTGKIGYKKIFFIGYLIPGILAILCFFIPNIWFILTAVCLASIGLAMTEATSESYFFDILKPGEDERFYAPYNTAVDAGNLTGELICAVLLIFLPFKSIFIVYGVGMISLSILSLSIKEIIESKRNGKFK